MGKIRGPIRTSPASGRSGFLGHGTELLELPHDLLVKGLSDDELDKIYGRSRKSEGLPNRIITRHLAKTVPENAMLQFFDDLPDDRWAAFLEVERFAR